MTALLQVDGETRKLVWKAFQQLFWATHNEIKLDIKMWLQERLLEVDQTKVIVPE